MKIVFISHCGIEDNSALHISALAAELVSRGHDCSILVPAMSAPIDFVHSGVPVIEYNAAIANGLQWKSHGETDLIHAWSPREHVRKAAIALTNTRKVPLVVHMEDNEDQIINDFLGIPRTSTIEKPPDEMLDLIPHTMAHPRRYREFIGAANGYTCVIDRLLEFKPPGVPSTVFWPGFDDQFLSIGAVDLSVRQEYGFSATDILIFYSGNVHQSNVGEVGALYRAVMMLWQRGYPVKLVKTGKLPEPSGLPTDIIDGVITNLGFVPRSNVIRLLSMCDILVQPGASNPFNDYRFPSKLPEYLASGRPVILPNSNIGRELHDGQEVLKLATGSSEEIADKVEILIENTSLGQKLGVNARNFARKYLSWPKAADVIEPFYKDVLDRAALQHLKRGKTNASGK